MSSPFPSPFGIARTSSPRAFWEGKSQENNRPRGDSVGRRSSLEKLKRASRVQNNTKIFQKPDDTAPPPRPMSYHGAGLSSPYNSPQVPRNSKIPLPMPKKLDPFVRPETPPKQATKLTSILTSPGTPRMPGKPSLISSYRTNNYEGEGGSYSEIEGYEQVNRSSTRRPKSVTFDKEPPDVLEYEMVTPDPSVEGSPAMHYDSDEDEEDEDELEHTPVIEPDQWERISPESVVPASFEDTFRSTPSPNARPLPPIPGVFNSRRESGSPSSSRPLPSIPVTRADLENLEKVPLEERVRLMMQEDAAGHEQPSRRRSTESNQPIREQGGEEEEEAGLGIMMDDISPSNRETEGKHDIRRESVSPSQLEDGDTSDSDETSPNSNRGLEIESGSSSHYESAPEYEPPPRLSRESIRRQVEARREHSFDSQQIIQEDSSENDTYLFGQENSTMHESKIEIKQEHSDDESIDVYAIPDMYNFPERPASRFNTRSPDLSEVTGSEASRYDDDDNESRYSEFGEDENAAETTPIPPREEFTPTPTKFQPSIALEKGELVAGQQTKEEVLQEGTNVGIAPDDPRMSLPEFSSIFGAEGLGLTAYMTPSPPLLPVEAPKPEPLELTPSSELAPSSSIVREFFTQQLEPEEQTESTSDELITDDEDTGSVIRHKIYHSDIEEDEDEDFDSSEELDDGELSDTGTIQAARSPSPVAESIATIRVPSGMLKTRASATPADMAAMAAARRQASGEIRIPPPVPRIPKVYHSEGEPSLSSDDEDDIPEEDITSADEGSERKLPEKKRKPIGLPALGEFKFDLKLDDLTEEFDRVIETQKVLHSANLLE